MRYNGASHGYRCNARTRPSTCKKCKARVFYFSCDCGCKVYFSSLGGKWPEHVCISTTVVMDTRNLQRGSIAELMRNHKKTASPRAEAERQQQAEKQSALPSTSRPSQIATCARPEKPLTNQQLKRNRRAFLHQQEKEWAGMKEQLAEALLINKQKGIA